MSVPLLNDGFWAENCPSVLHGPTVLHRLRAELSEGRSALITVAEAFAVAQTELGYHPSLCIFAEGEIGRPLWVIGAVWGYKKYGMEAGRSRSFGCFLGSYAGGDAILGGAGDKYEKQAARMLRQYMGQRSSLNGPETNEILDQVIAFYQG